MLTSYSDIFSHAVAYLEPCVTRTYSDPCYITYSESLHIQSSGIFRTRNIFRTLSRYILAYSETCVMVTYWETCQIQNFAIFRILANAGPEHIQAYSITIQLNSCNLNSCNSKNHLNRTNSSVLSEFIRKPLQENSFILNSHNSKNHLNRTNIWVPWTYFSSCNLNFGFGV